MLKELVHHVVRELVDSPDEVSVNILDEESQVTVQIKVPVEDFKRVIGKEGRVIKAIKTMACSLVSCSDKRVVVDIVK